MLGQEHISFCTTKLGSIQQVQTSKDPDGMRIFYYLVQVGCVSFSDLCWSSYGGSLTLNAHLVNCFYNSPRRTSMCHMCSLVCMQTAENLQWTLRHTHSGT